MSPGMRRTIILLCLIALGYILKKAKVIDQAGRKALGKLFTSVTFPAVILTSYAHMQCQLSLLWMILLGLAVSLCMMAVMLLYNKKQSKENRAFAIINCSAFSIGSFAVPFLQGYLSTDQLLPALLFDIGNGVMAFSGAAAVGQSILSANHENRLRAALCTLARSPSIWAYFLALLLYITQKSLPDIVYEGLNLVGSANAVLAMLVIGLTLDFPKRPGVFGWIGKLLALHYGTVLLLALLLYYILPYPETIRALTVVLLFCPLASVGPVNTDAVGLDHEAAGILNTFTIVVGIVAITILIPFMGIGG